MVKIEMFLYMYMHTYTMTKIVSLSNIAYNELKLLKRSGDSFSDVVIKLVDKTKKKSLLDFFGKWPGDEKEIKEIKKKLEQERKNFKTREVTF